jgi:hypothetical protein
MTETYFHIACCCTTEGIYKCCPIHGQKPETTTSVASTDDTPFVTIERLRSYRRLGLMLRYGRFRGYPNLWRVLLRNPRLK